MKTKSHRLIVAATAAGFTLGAASGGRAARVSLNPRAMATIATIDPAYQSYNLEMVSVIGGKWWAPYATTGAASAARTSTASGISEGALSARPPIDLSDPRLRRLTAALSPAYLRVSDKWANSMFFQIDASPAPPPAGFDSVLTAAQWKGVVDFSRDVGARLMTSFAISPGTRDAEGNWTPAEATKILSYTADIGGKISAVEFFNEPNLAVIEGAPKGYGPHQYALDFTVFEQYLRVHSPGTLIFGPGSVGELRGFAKLPGALKSEDMLRAADGRQDGVSYHFYGAFSQRCPSMGAQYQIKPADALSKAWLTAALSDTHYYLDLRDQFEPGKPLWLTETSEAACGGDPWAADFVDSFRYLNQLGLLAGHGVSLSMHNTLIGSDYGLIDDQTLTPRPNYWAALLWRKLVGTKVLDAGQTDVPNLYLHAFGLRGTPGGVVVLAINADPKAAVTLDVGTAFRRYTLTAPSLFGTEVMLNGTPLSIATDGALPILHGRRGNGTAILGAESISFIAIEPGRKGR